MSENACIICMDDGVETLLENKSCKCKYKTHATCWERYRQTTNPLKCPTCRRIITSSIQIAPSAPPASNVYEYTILPEIVISAPRTVTPVQPPQTILYPQSYQTQVIINNTVPLINESLQIRTVIQQRRLWNDLTPEEKKKRLIISGIIGITAIIIIIIVIYYSS